MEDTLIAALKSMLTLQRWNLHPRIDTWVEAENAAMVTHFAYGVARDQLNDRCMLHLLFRTLLQSLNKHYMTDISRFITDKLKTEHKDLWGEVVDGYADKTAQLFPRSISNTVKPYLTHGAGYANRKGLIPKITAKEMKKIEKIVSFCKLKTAMKESKINRRFYSGYYAGIKKTTEDDLKNLGAPPKCFGIAEKNRQYFDSIARLKFIRRWNSFNRFLTSSVLGHTYLVTILALTFSVMDKGDDSDFILTAVLQALFHDVPESFTGDIITPVKEEINRRGLPIKGDQASFIQKIENELMMEQFSAHAPAGVLSDIQKRHLLDEPGYQVAASASSLVKDCDRLALMVECLSEKEARIANVEMEKTSHRYYQELSLSEWDSVRMCLQMWAGHWLKT